MTDTPPDVLSTLTNMRRHAENARPGHVVYPNDPQGKLYHLRPTKHGITVSSTSHETPQMGFNIHIRKWKGIDQINWQPMKDKPGRNTPEKQLQAFLIRSALKNDRKLPATLSPQGCTLWFLVDELVVQNGKGAGDSRRGDIIAICEDEHGHIRPAFIELKSNRASTELQGQIRIMHEAFYDPQFSRERLAALHRYAEVVLDKVRPGTLPYWSESSKRPIGMMVWPRSAHPKRQTPAEIKGCKDIDLHVVGYFDQFSFEHEVPTDRMTCCR